MNPYEQEVHLDQHEKNKDLVPETDTDDTKSHSKWKDLES